MDIVWAIFSVIANISKHKYKLYARSSRTRGEIIGIIRPITTHRHSFVHQGRLAIFFQSQPVSLFIDAFALNVTR